MYTVWRRYSQLQLARPSCDKIEVMCRTDDYGIATSILTALEYEYSSFQAALINTENDYLLKTIMVNHWIQPTDNYTEAYFPQMPSTLMSLCPTHKCQRRLLDEMKLSPYYGMLMSLLRCVYVSYTSTTSSIYCSDMM